MTLIRCLNYGVLGAEVHEQDEVDDFAGDEVRVPSLESVKGHAEAVDLLGDRNDVVKLRNASISRPVARFNELLEVTAEEDVHRDQLWVSPRQR